MQARVTQVVAPCLLLLCAAWMVCAQEQDETPASHAAEATIKAYAEAFNLGDAAAMAACWTEKGVYTSRSTGEEISGRESLQAEFTALLQTTNERKLSIELSDVQLISPSVATQSGTVLVSGGEQEVMESGFSVVYVQVGDAWLIDRVTEEPIDNPPSNYEHLKVLEWMIGDWVDETGDGQIAASCHWTKNNNFIIRTFSTGAEGGGLSGMQLIGWDPADQRIRSWAFDSDGGFAEGSWSQKDDSWIVTNRATLPDGGRGSATTVFRVLDNDRFTWQRVNRMVDGEILPNLDEIVIVRQLSGE